MFPILHLFRAGTTLARGVWGSCTYQYYEPALIAFLLPSVQAHLLGAMY